MNYMSKITILSTMLLLSACSSTKYKNISTPSEYETLNKWMLEGNKSPKDLVTKVGTPLHAFYTKGKDLYKIYYPVSNKELTLTDVVFNQQLGCFIFDFERSDVGYKYQPSNFAREANCKVDFKEIEIEPSLIK